jgi:para-aminobenzoate synthetase / 4-amino-4-deoxychorismate lyase
MYNEVHFSFFDHLTPGPIVSFKHPSVRIVAYQQSEILDALTKIDRLREKGFYLAGYISYEAGYALLNIDPISKVDNKAPLLDFYTFSTIHHVPQIRDEQSSPVFHSFTSSLQTSEYSDIFSKAYQFLVAGESYQINLTFQNSCKSQGSLNSLYQMLARAQPVSYGVCAETVDLKILSVSPELFFKKTGEKLTTKPMKGTFAHEEENPLLDKTSEKYKKLFAENVMIVDLLRNDFSQIADPTTVHVDHLMEVESYPSLNQLVSTLTGQVEVETRFSQIISKLFPCGSITGAPKKRTLELIRDLEKSPRGIYTGCIGYITPTNDMQFNVAIRTLVGDGKNWSYGVGGGVIIGSTPVAEYEEALLKSRFLQKNQNDFSVFETMYFDGAQIPLLDEHLLRAEQSALNFSIPFEKQKIQNSLAKKLLEFQRPQRVRLELSQTETSIQVEKIIPLGNNLKITISPEITDSQDILYKHKTSMRRMYDSEWKKAQEQGFYDVLFVNEKGHITEASRHNIFIQQWGKWYTPPLSDGLLPGIQRQHEIRRLQAEEKSFTHQELLGCEKIVLTNALRGKVEVILEGRP